MKKILGAADGTRPPMLPYFDGLLAAPGGSESARPGTVPSSVWIARVGVWEPTVIGWDRCFAIAQGGPEGNRPTGELCNARDWLNGTEDATTPPVPRSAMLAAGLHSREWKPTFMAGTAEPREVTALLLSSAKSASSADLHLDCHPERPVLSGVEGTARERGVSLRANGQPPLADARGSD